MLPTDSGIFEGVSLNARACFGMILDRYKLSMHSVMTGNNLWLDWNQQVYCVITHEEMARHIGICEHSARIACHELRDNGLVTWYKGSWRGANRYSIPSRVYQILTSDIRAEKQKREEAKTGTGCAV